MTFRHLTLDELLESGRDHKCAGVGPDHVCVKLAAVAEESVQTGAGNRNVYQKGAGAASAKAFDAATDEKKPVIQSWTARE